MEQLSAGVDRLQLLRESAARVSMAAGITLESPADLGDLDPQQARRDAEYLAYLAGKLDPRD